VIDVGVAADGLSFPGVFSRRVALGTGDISSEPSMSRDELDEALLVGRASTHEALSSGARLLVLGEMGIANTTAASALTSVFCGVDAASVTGPGTGLTRRGVARKVTVVRRAIDVNSDMGADPFEILRCLGGLEIASLCGALVTAAHERTPVILDGFVVGAAALAASSLSRGSQHFFVAGHRSVEPGHRVQLKHLQLKPLMDLEMRLGEGTGAALCIPLVRAAIACVSGMARLADL